jgi:putative transposase
LHVIQRGNNRGSVFFGPADYAHYRDWLGEAAAEYGCAIHAYVFMTDHVHLLVTPRGAGSLPGAMQSLGRRIAWPPLCPLCQKDLRNVSTIMRQPVC